MATPNTSLIIDITRDENNPEQFTPTARVEGDDIATYEATYCFVQAVISALHTTENDEQKQALKQAAIDDITNA